MGGQKAPRQVSTLTSEQRELLQALLPQIQELAPEAFGQIRQQLRPELAQQRFEETIATPAIQQFQREIVPGIMQQFAGLGAKGGTSLERQLARAGAGLEEQLGRERATFQAQAQQQGIQNLLSVLFPGVQTQAIALQERQPSFGSQLAGGLFGLGGTLLGGGR